MNFFKKSDTFIIIAILVIGIGGIFAYKTVFGTATTASIYYENTLIKRIKLNEQKEETFSVDNYENVTFHLYADGSIAFETSDCPDKICVNTGRIKIAGESAVCLPNKLVLKVEIGNNSGIDGFSK